MSKDVSEFDLEAQGRRSGLVGDFIAFLKHNRKWWLLPILVVMALVAVLIVLVGTGAAPFIYTLF